MSAVLAFHAPRGGVVDALAPDLIRALAARGGGEVTSWRDERAGVLLAALRRPEEAPGGASLTVLGDVVVAADAALYYRRALAAAIRAAGVFAAETSTAAELVAAAYRVWGARCLERLEGDFAIALWDAASGRLLLARDLSGARPLFWGRPRQGGAVAASALGALLRIPGIDASLDAGVLAESATWSFLPHGRTVRRGVERVAPGAAVELQPASGARADWRHADAPVFERDAAALPFAEAAPHLRGLIADAVAERRAGSGPTAVWMSGGYDSTAVYAAGRSVDAAEELLPISVSFPPGDAGREDELIEAVAARWSARVRWVRSTDVDLFAPLAATMAASDEPFTHLYAEFNATLARTTAGEGARVALGGYGGDQLFWSSPVFLADLLRRGGVRTLWREARLQGLGAAGLLRWAVRPWLPEPAFAGARRLGLGEGWLPPHERPLPAWLDRDFARRQRMAGALRRAMPRRPGETHAAYDAYFAIANPFFARVLEAVTQVVRAEGVEYRSPLYDRRVMAFAATRPRWERASDGQQKHLLRHAMRPLLPAMLLARRPFRTGTTRDLFAASAARWLPALLREIARAPRLADVGVLDADAFRRAIAPVVEGGDVHAAAPLVSVLQTELWLRGAVDGSERSGSAAPPRVNILEPAVA